MGGVRRIPSVLSAATALATNAVLSTTVSTAMSTRVGSVMLVRFSCIVCPCRKQRLNPNPNPKPLLHLSGLMVGSVMLVRFAAFEWVGDSVEWRECCVAA